MVSKYNLQYFFQLCLANNLLNTQIQSSCKLFRLGTLLRVNQGWFRRNSQFVCFKWQHITCVFQKTILYIHGYAIYNLRIKISNIFSSKKMHLQILSDSTTQVPLTLSHILSPSPPSSRILSQNNSPVWQKHKTSALSVSGVSCKEREWGGEELAHGPHSYPSHCSLGSRVPHHPPGTSAPLPPSTWPLPTFSPHALLFFPLIIRLFTSIIIIIIVWVLQLAHHPLLH